MKGWWSKECSMKIVRFSSFIVDYGADSLLCEPLQIPDAFRRMKANKSTGAGQVLNHSCCVVAAASLSAHPKLPWPKGNSLALSTLCENLFILLFLSANSPYMATPSLSCVV